MKNHFHQLNAHYKTWLVTLGFSKSIALKNPHMVCFFLEYLKQNGVYHISQLTHQNVIEYFNYLENRPNFFNGKPLSAAHLNKCFFAIDKFLEFLIARGSVNTPSPLNYRILITKQEAQQKIKTLTPLEIKILYASCEKIASHFNTAHAEPRSALGVLILDLCYGCGLRKTEVFNLTMSDVDLDKKILFVRQAKGYKDRLVPMSESITNRIKLFMYQYRSYFEPKHNRLFPLTSKESIYHYIKILKKQSGIEKPFGLHTLRHSIATHLLQNGMSIEQIALFLGHSSLESTQVYTHLISDHV
jgi:integrase/recombinase XerD